ncbi:MAG: archaea-specific SMC-related protein [Halodesulfurarchaeum sp.]
MADENVPIRDATVSVQNIGGIEETQITLQPGVTVLKGENATNRTSFLRAVMAALGSDHASLKADAEQGHVELSLAGETYTREYRRTDAGVRVSGDPYLDDPTPAEYFAFLLEGNAARRAVTIGEDLRSVIMKPVDTTAIRAEITQKQARKSNLDDELAALDELRDRRPTLKERLRSLEDEIAEKQGELKDLQETIEGTEANLSETKAAKAALEEAFEEIQSLRSERRTVEERLENERKNLNEARSERERLEAELAEVSTDVSERRREIKSRVSSLREEKRTLESTVSELQNLVQFNEDQLEGETGVFGDLQESTGAVTEKLVGRETVTCWTCGSTVERGQIEDTIESLSGLRAEKLERVDALDAEIRELSEEANELESRRHERKHLERELESLRDEISSRERTIDDLESECEDLDDAIEDAEEHVETLEFAERQDELLELHQQANRLELQLEELKADRGRVESELEEIDGELERESALREKRDAITGELTELRTRIERIETDAIEEFNERMEEILSVMDYTNIARIWLERRHRGDSSVFELHVVRSDDAGTAYEDTVAHLSESEREVTGLIFALAGYLVHEVSELVPFMLLDSVEALDSERIGRLLEYFEDHVPYLLVALLPEDARAVDERHPRITEI